METITFLFINKKCIRARREKFTETMRNSAPHIASQIMYEQTKQGVNILFYTHKKKNLKVTRKSSTELEFFSPKSTFLTASKKNSLCRFLRMGVTEGKKQDEVYNYKNSDVIHCSYPVLRVMAAILF